MLVKWFVLFWLFSRFLQGIAQYHQTDYNVKPKIIEVSDFNHSYFSDIKVGLQWYNRSTRVINGNGTLIKGFGTNLKLKIQVYKFLSNEYRFFPITITINLCREVPRNMYGSKDLLRNFSNIPVECPVKTNFYHMRNGQFDFSQFPPYIPTGDYKVEAKVINGEDYVGEIHGYGSIEENKKQWWK